MAGAADFGRLGAALRAAWSAAGARQRSRPPAQSWRAQFNELTRSGRGQAALTGAGVDPGRGARNWRRWLAGDHQPSKANQRRIAEAYRQWFGPGVERRGPLGDIKARPHHLSGPIDVGDGMRNRGDGRAPLTIGWGRDSGDWSRVEDLWLSGADDEDIGEAWWYDVVYDDLDLSEDITTGGAVSVSIG